MNAAPAEAQTVVAGALSAGRYAAYVWPAYGVTLLGFVWMSLDTTLRARRWRRKVDQLEPAAPAPLGEAQLDHPRGP